jgi:hypothetical protein
MAAECRHACGPTKAAQLDSLYHSSRSIGGAPGLVKRMPSRDDRRCVLVRPSSKGVELFRKIYPEGARCNRSLFEKAFKPEQVKELSAVFSRS